jgi:hypothetical protein
MFGRVTGHTEQLTDITFWDAGLNGRHFRLGYPGPICRIRLLHAVVICMQTSTCAFMVRYDVRRTKALRQPSVRYFPNRGESASAQAIRSICRLDICRPRLHTWSLDLDINGRLAVALLPIQEQNVFFHAYHADLASPFRLLSQSSGVIQSSASRKIMVWREKIC